MIIIDIHICYVKISVEFCSKTDESVNDRTVKGKIILLQLYMIWVTVLHDFQLATVRVYVYSTYIWKVYWNLFIYFKMNIIEKFCTLCVT